MTVSVARMKRRVIWGAMSIKRFESMLLGLLGGGTVPDPSDQIKPGFGSRADTTRALNAAFLMTLAGTGHRLFWEADVLFEKIIRTEEGSRLGRYFQRGRSAIWREIEPLGSEEPKLEEILTALAFSLTSAPAKHPDPVPVPSDQPPNQKDTLTAQKSPLSEIPVTVAYLRSALAAATLFAAGRDEEAAELLERFAEHV